MGAAAGQPCPVALCSALGIPKGAKPRWAAATRYTALFGCMCRYLSLVPDLSFALGPFLLQSVAARGAEASVLRCGREEQRATFLSAIFPLRLVTRLTGKLLPTSSLFLGGENVNLMGWMPG